ncbi:MAG: hypothetical protein OEY78_01180 [Gammaproteobacteria bacterium]|nr:hypothetical protein [Gammaproteobacteria bacterium]
MSYKILQQTDSQLAHLQFEGLFQGQNVTWDTHFFTLQGYQSLNIDVNQASKQFIDIKPIDSNHLKLTIALKIPEINHQNIQKMMIMIKQYKNLSLGRHEYG